MSGFRSDHLLIRDYVTAADHLQYSQLPEGVVAICLTHCNLPTSYPDLRLDLHMTILQVKERFHLHIGTPVEYQRLILKSQGNVICEIDDNSRMLGFYSVTSGMEIHVIDTDPFSLSRGGGLTDTSLIQRYQMTDEDYDKRKGTMRDYIKEQRAKNPNFKLKSKGPSENKDVGPPPGPESVQHVVIGSRCEVNPGSRRGEVRFVGEVEGLKPGYWVGVHFDEPLGRSDGIVNGNTIFETLPKHGGFVRGNNVQVGDFPERDIFGDESDHDHENENESQEETEI